MYLIVTRSFPPELGGMQSLMWGSSRELSKNILIKVFADYIDNHKDFDEQASFSIERVGGIKLLRKYSCLLYTSDAADDSLRVDLGGRRIIKKNWNKFCSNLC